jgi:tRNA(Arg) A34 adenosine deaminase TadA
MTPVDVEHLRRCIELAHAARRRGDDPFGSVLVGGDGAVLAEESNMINTRRDVTAHPELALASWSAHHLSPAERRAATMYTSCEHCAMCAGAHYWAGIGRLVFALSGHQLGELAPSTAPMLELSSREVFERGNVSITVDGPCDELASEARDPFIGLWAP